MKRKQLEQRAWEKTPANQRLERYGRYEQYGIRQGKPADVSRLAKFLGC